MLSHIDLKILDDRPAQRSPNIQTLQRTLAIDRPLDLEQRVDPTDDLDRNWRERDFLFAGGLAPCVLFDVGHGKERTPRMRPTGRFPDRSGMAPSQIELVVPVIGVSLQETGIAGQMRLRMLTLAVARVVEHRRRRSRSAKRPIIPYVNPASSRVGLSLGQDRHRRIIGMEALGHHDMGFDQAQQGIKRSTD